MSKTNPRKVVPFPTPVPVASVQGTLALDLQPRHEPPRAPVLGATAGAGSEAGVVRIDRGVRRDLEQWSRRYAQAAVEIVGGDRPVSQLLRWTLPEVYDDLRRRTMLVARAGGHQPGLARVQPVQPRVLSVHTCFIRPDAVEASVHVRYGQRSRALAARFERIQQRWVCAALDFS